MATDFAFDPIFEAEAAACWASLDEDIGSANYDQQLRDENAVAMLAEIEKLELLNACATMLPGVRAEVEVIIATMKRIMPALD